MEKLNNLAKQELIKNECKKIYQDDSLNFEDQEELAYLVSSFIKYELNDYLPNKDQ